MPEGHTLHRLARDQQELVGRTVAATSPQGRFRDGAAAVDGAVLATVEARGKHLLQHFDADGTTRTVHIHLGMQGVTLRSAPPATPRPQVRLRVATEDVAWDLIAPSRCELLDDAGVAALVATLGPDPLRPDADPDWVRERFRTDGRAVGTVLLDQSVLAGVGNVFRAEVLHAIGVHPSRPASELDDDCFRLLWERLGAAMVEAVDAGTIAPGGRSVYKQQTCADCGAPVEQLSVGGRTAYRCTVEQPR